MWAGLRRVASALGVGDDTAPSASEATGLMHNASSDHAIPVDASLEQPAQIEVGVHINLGTVVTCSVLAGIWNRWSLRIATN